MSGENPKPANSPSQDEIDAALAASAVPSAPAAEAVVTGGQDAPTPMGDTPGAAIPEGVDSSDAAVATLLEQPQQAASGSMALELPDFSAPMAAGRDNGIELLSDVELDVKIELGRASMLIEDVLKLGEGSVVELDKLAGDPVDVFVNDRLVARGEVLVLNDNFCVRVSEIVAGQELAGEGA